MFLHFFLAWLFAIPLIVFKGYYEEPKVFVFYVGIIALIIYWTIKVLKEHKYFDLTKADLFFFLWLLTLILSSLIGVHTWESLIGGSYRNQGVLFFAGLWLTGKTVAALTKERKIQLTKLMGALVIVESLIVFIQIITDRLYFDRALGTLGEAGAVAGMIAGGIYFVYKGFPNKYLIVPALAVASTFSRSGVLSLFVSLNLLKNFIKGNLKKFLFPGTIVLGIIAAGIFSFGKVESLVESRSVIWKLGMRAVSQRPLFGYGAESGEVVYDKLFESMGIRIAYLTIDRAHNLLLDILMWSGVIGLIFFTLWVYEIFRGLNVNKKIAAVSILVFSMFMPLSIVHWIFFFIVVNI